MCVCFFFFSFVTVIAHHPAPQLCLASLFIIACQSRARQELRCVVEVATFVLAWIEDSTTTATPPSKTRAAAAAVSANDTLAAVRLSPASQDIYRYYLIETQFMSARTTLFVFRVFFFLLSLFFFLRLLIYIFLIVYPGLVLSGRTEQAP